MERGNLSRRGFVANSLGVMAAAGLPIWFAKETILDAQEKDVKTPRLGPNDRIVMGAIGTGTNRSTRPNDTRRGERGVHIMQAAMSEAGVQMAAVCDVDRPNAEFAQNLVRTAARRRQPRMHVVCRLPPAAGKSRHQRGDHRHSRPLARPDRHRRDARR